MRDAGSRASEDYTIGTGRRWLGGWTLLVGVLGVLVMVAVAAIPAAALGGLPTASTSTLASPTQISYVCVNKSSGQLF